MAEPAAVFEPTVILSRRLQMSSSRVPNRRRCRLRLHPASDPKLVHDLVAIWSIVVPKLTEIWLMREYVLRGEEGDGNACDMDEVGVNRIYLLVSGPGRNGPRLCDKKRTVMQRCLLCLHRRKQKSQPRWKRKQRERCETSMHQGRHRKGEERLTRNRG